MKKLLAISLLFLSSSVFARIGETPAECVARYGEPVTGKKTTDWLAAATEISFLKAGILVTAYFHEGRCEQIAFSNHEDGGDGDPKALTENEIDVLLRSNGGGKLWNERPTLVMDRVWDREDGYALAQYSMTQNLLVIRTSEAHDRAEKEKKAEEQKKLDGF